MWSCNNHLGLVEVSMGNVFASLKADLIDQSVLEVVVHALGYGVVSDY